jgi:hypothetical protein
MLGSGREARDDAWRNVAQSQKGDVVAGKRWLKKVRFDHHVWTVVLDQYTVSTGKSSATYTRLRALYEPGQPFRFKMYRENVLARIGKFLGMQDVQTGDPLLDRDYIVRTDNESMIRSLVAGSRIGELLVGQRTGKLETASFRGRRKPRPERAAELRWQTGGVVKDPERLRQLVELFRETLDRMAKIGAAREVRVPYEL